MKLEAPETRALVRLLNEWNPALTVDTHTTNGSHHRYTLTYDGPKNPAGDRGLIDFSRTELFPAVTAAFRQGTGRDAYFYGNFESNHTRWDHLPQHSPLRHDVYRPAWSAVRPDRSVQLCPVRRPDLGDPRLLPRDHRVRRHPPRRDPRPARGRAPGHDRGLAPGGRDPRPAPRSARPGGDSRVRRADRETARAVATGVPRDYPCAVEGDFEPTVHREATDHLLHPPRPAPGDRVASGPRDQPDPTGSRRAPGRHDRPGRRPDSLGAPGREAPPGRDHRDHRADRAARTSPPGPGSSRHRRRSGIWPSTSSNPARMTAWRPGTSSTIPWRRVRTSRS